MNNQKNLKKQLLEARNTIAELQFENKNFEEKIIDLESNILNFEEQNNNLINTKLNFETTLQLEREKIYTQGEKKFKNIFEKVEKAEKKLDNKNLKIDYLEKQIKNKDIIIKDLEDKLSEIFEDEQNTESLNFLDLLKKEQKEKEKLHKKIITLSKDLNELREINNKIRSENQKIRYYYKVPENFGEDFKNEENFNNFKKENPKAQIKYLKKEIEELEEERAALKCKLRQLSGIVSNTNSSNHPLLTNLDEEKKHLLNMYILNLKDDKFEIPLNDKSKSLKKKCDLLEAQLNFYKEKSGNKEEEMIRLIRELGEFRGVNQRVGGNRKTGSFFRFNKFLGKDSKDFRGRFGNEGGDNNRKEFEIRKGYQDWSNGNSAVLGRIGSRFSNNINKEIGNANLGDNNNQIVNHNKDLKNQDDDTNNYNNNYQNQNNYYDNNQNMYNTNENFEKISKEINLIEDQQFLKESLVKNIIELECLTKDLEYFTNNYYKLKSLIEKKEEISKKLKLDYEKKIENIKEELKDLRKEKLEDNRKNKILEKKIKNYDLIFKENLKEENIDKLFRENLIMVDKLSCLERENSLYSSKLQNYQKKISYLKSELDIKKKNKIKFEEDLKQKLKQKEKKMEELIINSINKVELKDFRSLTYKNIFLKEELTNLKLESASSSEILADLKINQINYEKTILKNTELEIINSNLIFEIKMTRKIFEGKDEEFEYFLKIVKDLSEKIFRKGEGFGFFKKFGDFENRGFLSNSDLKKIFNYFDLQFTKYDCNILKKFFLVEENKNIHFRDLVFKLKIMDLSFSDLYLQKNFMKIFQALDSLNMGPFELFQFFDVHNKKQIYFEDFVKGIENLNLKIDKFLIKSFYQTNLTSEDDFFTKEEFVSFFNHYLSKNSKIKFLTKNENNWQFQIGNEILEFIYANKNDYKNINEFFDCLDPEKKGFLIFKDILDLFEKKLKLNFERKSIENFFVIIDKKISDRIYKEEFEKFLVKCGDMNRIEVKINNFVNFGDEINIDKKIDNENILQDKIEFLIREKKIFEENMDKLNFQLKQKNLTLNYLEKKNVEMNKNQEKLKKQINKIRKDQFNDLSKKEKNQNEKMNFFTKQDDSEKFKTLYETEKKLNQQFMIQNENLKLQITKLEDELTNFINLKFKESSNLSQNTQNVQLMMNYLNAKYEEGDFQIEIKKLKENLNSKCLEIFSLKEKLNEITNKKFELQMFLIDKINFLQKELTKLQKNEYSIFDIKKLNFVERQIKGIVKNMEELQIMNNELRIKNKNLEIDFESLKIKNDNSANEVYLIGNEDLILKKYEKIVDENKNLKIKGIRNDKDLMFLGQDKKNLEKKISNQDIFIKKLEEEIKVNFNNINEREKYWTKKIQEYLKKRDIISIEKTPKIQRLSKKKSLNNYQNTNSSKFSKNHNKNFKFDYIEETPDENINKNISRSSKIIKNLQASLNVQIEQNSELQEKLKNHSNENRLIQIETNIKEKKIILNIERDQEKILRAAQGTIRVLKTMLEEKELEISELKEDNKDYRNDILRFKNEINVLEIKIENFKLDRNLEVEKGSFCEAKIKLGVKKTLDRKKHDDYQIMLKDYKARINLLVEEKNDLKKLNVDLVNQMKVLKDKNNVLVFNNNEETIFKKNEKIKKIENSNQQYEFYIKDLEKINSDQKNEINSLKYEIGEISELKNEEIKKKNTLKRITNSKNKDYLQKIRILKNKYKKILNDFEITKLQKEDLENKFKQCNNKAINLNMRLIKKDDKILRLQKKIRFLNKNPILVEEEKIEKNLNSQNRKLKESQKLFQRKLENLKKEKDKNISKDKDNENLKLIKKTINENLKKKKEENFQEEEEILKINKNNINKQIILKSSNNSKFENFEEFILVLKNELLADRAKLIFLSKDLKSIFKDKKIEKLPEKILDLFKSYNILINIRDQRNFVLWFLKYNKSDFFKNFYVNIISLKNYKSIIKENILKEKLGNNNKMNKKQFSDLDLLNIKLEEKEFEIKEKNKTIIFLDKKMDFVDRIKNKIDNCDDKIVVKEIKELLLLKIEILEFEKKQFIFFIKSKESFYKIFLSFSEKKIEKVFKEKKYLKEQNKLIMETKGDKLKLKTEILKSKNNYIKILEEKLKQKNFEFNICRTNVDDITRKMLELK